MAITIDTSIDLTGAAAGLGQLTSMVDAAVANMNRKMVAGGGGMAAPLGFGGIGGSRVGGMVNEMEKMIGLTGRLNQGLDRMTSLFTGGLGFGVALGGIGLFTAALSRSIEKAREFQTAQIAIAATIQSSYRIGPPGTKTDWTTSANPADRAKAFQVASVEAAKLNQDIIQRQAKNILTYQEELQAFQSSLAPGARKNLSTKQVLNISENAAVVAKSIGLRGEEIANAARLLMGGGVNVGRSTIGRVLGIKNQDVLGKSGKEFETFINERLKGFEAAQPTFAKSIEGVMSTLEAQLDVYLANIGTKLMKGISGSIESLGKALEGPGAEKFGDTLVDLFASVGKGIEAIATSPAIPTIMKFISFLAANGDKIVIGIALMSLIGIVTKVGGSLKSLVGWFGEIAATAATAAGAVDGLAMATNNIGGSGALARGVGVKGGKVARMTANEMAIAAEAEIASANLMAQAAFKGGRFGSAGGNVAAGARGAFRDPTTGKFISKTEAALRGSRGSFLAGQAQMDALGGVVGANYLAGRIPGVMGPMQQASLRERAIKTFGTEGVMSKKMLSLIERNPQMASNIMSAMAVGGQMGKNGLTALIGTQIAGMVLPEKMTSNPLFSVATNGIVAGATAAPLAGKMWGALSGTAGKLLGLAGGAGVGATLGTNFGALLAAGGLTSAAAIGTGVVLPAIAGGLIGKEIRQSVWRGADDPDEVARQKAGRDYQEKKIPLAAKHEELFIKKKALEKAIKTGDGWEQSKSDESGWYNPKHWLGDLTFGYLADGFKPNKVKGSGFTPDQLKKSLAYVNKQLKDTEDVQKAVVISNNRDGVSKDIETRAKTLQDVAGIGWGLDRDKQRLEADRMMNQSKLIEMFNTPTGIPLDADLKGKLLTDYYTKGTQLHDDYGGKKLSASDMDKALRGAGQDLMYQRLTRENKERATNQSMVLDMQRKQLIDGAGLKTIDKEYEMGRAGIELQMAQSKGTLGAAYKPTLDKALHAFDVQFNKPLKEIEQQMGNLQLGVSSQHVIESAQLAFKAVRAKIKQAVQMFKETGEGLTPEQGAQYLREQQAQMKADVYRAMNSKQLGLGSTPEARIQNAAISEIAQQNFGNKAQLFGARGWDMSSGMMGTFGQIEAYRRSPGVNPNMVNQFAQDSINTQLVSMQRRMQDARSQRDQITMQAKYAPLELAQADLGVRSAKFADKKHGMVLTDYDKARWSYAEKMADYDEARKRGSQTMGDIRKAVDEERAMEKEGRENAILGAQAQKEGVEAQQKLNAVMKSRLDIDIAKMEQDYARAVQEATAYLDGMHGKGKGGGKPGDSKPGKPGEAGDTPPINFTINGGFTQSDVDRWMPFIRDRLCQMATQSGNRK